MSLWAGLQGSLWRTPSIGNTWLFLNFVTGEFVTFKGCVCEAQFQLMEVTLWS